MEMLSKLSLQDGDSCTFFMLDAAFVRKFPGKNLPFFHEIRDQYTTDEPLVEVALDYADVVKGTHIETTLAVSHRWMQPDDPDPDGEQLKALKDFLNSPAGQKIERVWIDSACMPQDQPKGSRIPEDAAAFKRMLKEVNRLYLGTTVLILLDMSYVSRFWTQFESWLAMQFATPSGLKSAVGTRNERHHIVCIQNAAAQAESFAKLLVDQWANKTPDEAHSFLSKPDVTVTNQSDKEGQLPKIKALDAAVQGALSEVVRQLEEELAASEAAAARAEAEARQAASVAAAAREAKKEHEYAIAIGAIPAIMRQWGVAWGSLSMSDVPELVLQLSGGGDKRKERAAAALANLAGANDDNISNVLTHKADVQAAIAAAGGIAPLVALARDGTDGQMEAAARALKTLARNADNTVAIAKAGGIAPLVALARDGSDDQKRWAAGALANLAYNAPDNQVAIAKAGGIAPLVALARDGTDGQKEYAAAALRSLANNADNRVAIREAGGIAPLVALARDGTDGQKEAAAVALRYLAFNADNQVAIARAGGIAPLVALARGGTDGQKKEAAVALRYLAFSKTVKAAIKKAGWK